tara:strand:- start:266 stop:745 length:480 start_codon:yes stop_codon:yes gene_type:complete
MPFNEEYGCWEPNPFVKKIIIASVILFLCFTAYAISCNLQQGRKVVGTYTVIMTGEAVKFQTLTLKDNGIGYFKNTEFEEYVGPEYCTFNYSIKDKYYKIKDGSYKYVSMTNYEGDNSLCQIINGILKIIEMDNRIELKFVLTNEETSNDYYFRKFIYD